MRLTNKAIKSFKYKGGWDVRWDETVPGLGLRIYPSGKKSFVLTYRASGRKRLMVLGRFGADLTIDQARDKARKLRVQVREGADPAEERLKAAGSKTFGELIDEYVKVHASRKATGAADERRLRLHIPASWRSRRASAIRRQEIADLHHRFGQRAPYEANRLLEVLRKMFKLAAVWGFVDEAAPNPAVGIEKFPEKKRQRWVTPEELRRLAQAIDGETNVYVRAAIWLFLLTGMRRSELLAVKWRDIDFTRAVLRLPKTKSGDEQSVSLSGAALAILQSVPRQEGNPYLLPGAKERKHLVNIGKPWNRMRQAATVHSWAEDDDPLVSNLVAGLQRGLSRLPTYAECLSAAEHDLPSDFELPTGLTDVRLHDLRRTVGSWLSQSGVDLNRIKDALRHQNISTTLTYARLGEDASREVMEEHGRAILKAAGKDRPIVVTGGGGKR